MELCTMTRRPLSSRDMNLIRNRTPDEEKKKNIPEVQGGNHDARGGKERTREGNATGENMKEEMYIGLMLQLRGRLPLYI